MRNLPKVLQQTLFSLTCLCTFFVSGCDLLGPTVDAAGIYVEATGTTTYDFRSDGGAHYYRYERVCSRGGIEYNGRGEWRARGKRVKFIGLVSPSRYGEKKKVTNEFSMEGNGDLIATTRDDGVDPGGRFVKQR